ncbi:MAG: helix-turn-helix domain-containing protein [Candidatus Woesearchaeota archaeon]
MDTKALQNIGLTDGEIRVYLALIKLGASTTGPITDKSRVSSSKIYNILGKLIQKGIVSYVVKQKTRYYQAEDPIKIRDYVTQREKEIQEQKIEIDKLIPELQFQKESEKIKSEVQIYKGFKGMESVLNHVYSELKKGDTFYDIGIPSFQEEKFHSYWHEDHQRRVKLGIKCKLLFNQDTPKKVIKHRNNFWGCDARYMPLPVETPAWFLIWNDSVALVLQSGGVMVIEIRNKDIAKSFKEYFDTFWNLSKPFK